MSQPGGTVRLLVVADFNASNLTALLRHDSTGPQIEGSDAPFGQVHQILADSSHPVWEQATDGLVIWTQPQRVISSFARALEHEAVEIEAVLAEVDQYAALIRECRNRARTVLVPTWTLPPWERGHGLLNLRSGVGVGSLLARMNLRLAEHLDAVSVEVGAVAPGSAGIYLLDAHRWLIAAGSRAYAPKAWYLGKIPFGTDVFKQALVEIKAALRAVAGDTRKLLVVDLDDTLWGGIVGDVGWENLTLGGHDGDGEALVDFQRALKALTRRGILLGVVSKNEETTALTALQEHPEMILRPHDFAGWRINWEDKARNVADLAAELNLGLQSVVFIDDNPAERARVSEALPEVFVPDWPVDKTQYRKALLELTCFDTAVVTLEDRRRTTMYASDRERKRMLTEVGSLEEWLATLEVRVEIECLNDVNLKRATQLLNKTNQMNLTTRRLTEAELRTWVDEPDHLAWTFKVADRFGDMGLTGLLSIATGSHGTAQIVDFVLSCRVMGRKVEETMLATAVREARARGHCDVVAEYLPTAKNQPCLSFFQRSGFHGSNSLCHFTWKEENDYPFPRQVTVHFAQASVSSKK